MLKESFAFSCLTSTTLYNKILEIQAKFFRDLTIFASWNDGKLRIFKVDFRLMEAHMSENSGEIFISVECRLFVIQHVCVQL